MAVGGCHRDYVEVCEIFVYASRPAPANASRYTRLRFGLLASSWLPNPLGIALWRALHVAMLVVGGPAFGALALLATFLYCDVFCLALLTGLVGLPFATCAVVAVAVDLVLFVGRSMRFCWSVVSTLACHAPIGDWRGASWHTLGDWRGAFWCTADCWETLVRYPFSADDIGLFTFGVPCMSGSWYMENKDRMWESWARWWKEVVHAQGAVVL